MGKRHANAISSWYVLEQAAQPYLTGWSKLSLSEKRNLPLHARNWYWKGVIYSIWVYPFHSSTQSIVTSGPVQLITDVVRRHWNIGHRIRKRVPRTMKIKKNISRVRPLNGVMVPLPPYPGKYTNSLSFPKDLRLAKGSRFTRKDSHILISFSPTS